MRAIRINLNLYFRFLAVILMFITYLPIFYENVPSFIRSQYLWNAIWILSIFFLRLKVFLDKNLSYVTAYFIIFFTLLLSNFWAALDYNSISMQSDVTTECIAFFISFSIVACFKSFRDFEGIAIIVKWTLFFICITAILTIISSFFDPLYARKIAGGETLTELFIYRLGGGTYGFGSALVCLFPMMIYFYRNNTQSLFSRKQILFFGIICFIALVRMQIFANVIVSSVFIILSLAGRNKIKKSIGVIIILFLIFSILPKQFYADLLIRISNRFDKNSEMFYKLTDMSGYITNPTEMNGAQARLNRYPMLWEAFNQNPIFGYFYKKNNVDITPGGHLYFMYKLAGWGILNFVGFLLIFVKCFKVNIKRYDEKYSFYFFLSFLSIITLGLFKHLVTRDLWYMIFFILPGLYYLKILKKGKTIRHVLIPEKTTIPDMDTF
jgi:hypothetical protein